MDALLGVIAAALLVLPGFVTQELTVRRRPYARADGQVATQRALFYSVIIQLVWIWDTWRLVEDLTGRHWRTHGAEVAVWVVLVVVVSPVLLGLAINGILLRAESGGGSLTRFHYALGGRDAREAWDYFFQTLDRGAWVLVRLIASTPTAPVMFIARYGTKARHAQSPSAHDVYFDELWSTDVAGRPLNQLTHLSGMWVKADQIEAMFPLADDETKPGSTPHASAEPFRTILDRGRLVVGWRPRPRTVAPVAMARVESQTAADPQPQGVSEKDSDWGPVPPP